jgi:hypothetical protein
MNGLAFPLSDLDFLYVSSVLWASGILHNTNQEGERSKYEIPRSI